MSVQWILLGTGPLESADVVAHREAGLCAKTYATVRHIEMSKRLDPATAGEMFDSVYESLRIQEQAQRAALAEILPALTGSVPQAQIALELTKPAPRARRTRRPSSQ